MNDEFRGEKSPANIGDFTDKDSSMTMVSASKLGPIETGEIWDGEPGWFRLDFPVVPRVQHINGWDLSLAARLD